MRVLQLSATDGNGGAARAAHRIHRALENELADSGIESLMLVGRKHSPDPAIRVVERPKFLQRTVDVARRVLDQERFLGGSPNVVFCSPARVPTVAPSRIEEIQPDLLLLHWLGSRMMSIPQIGRINRPAAWVLHDTWTFCGAEHYPNGYTDRRFADGYRRDNRLDGEWGLDVNRRAWDRKRKHWKRPMHLVAPSNWMADQASRSALVADWPVTVIPYPLDVTWWGALSRTEARKKLRIDCDVPVLLFGAIGGDRDPRKGAGLLYTALEKVASHHGLRPGRALEIYTFGGRPGFRRVGPHTVQSVGQLDDEGLRNYYTAADVMVVPSRMDNLPQTAVEAITCGTPVVAFRTGGLLDIVDDGINGRLVEPFRPERLAMAVGWVLESAERHHRLSDAARRKAGRWEPRRIARRYGQLFEEMLTK